MNRDYQRAYLAAIKNQPEYWKRHYASNVTTDGGTLRDAPLLGAELIPDASRWFSIDNDPYWSKGAGVIVGSGVCTFTNTPVYISLSTPVIFTLGKYYTISITVASLNGSVLVYAGGNSALSTITSNGVYTYTFKAETRIKLDIASGVTPSTFTIDNISVREVLQPSMTKAYYKMARENNIAKSIQFAWLGEGGIKQSSGRISKAYSLALGNANHATQTTSSSQPYLSGNIAPNERYALKNPNGGSNFITHPTISFAANESWSVTTVLNWNGTNNVVTIIYGNVDVSTTRIIIGSSGTLTFFNNNNESVTFAKINFNLIGKNSLVTLISLGIGSVSLYVNGLFSETKLITTNAVFSQLITAGSDSRKFYGKIYAHIIRSQALTQQQVTAEYNLLRSYIPEIESVQIGTQTWATSNCAVAASSNGTVIPDGTLTANWIAGTSYWCHHTDISTGAVYDKLYNKAAKLVLAANPPEGWHYATQAELTTIAALGGNALKVIGNSYWTTANGTNATGLSLLGSSKRNADGSFATIKSECYIWAADTDFVLKITDAGVATIEAANANDGYALRLVKN